MRTRRRDGALLLCAGAAALGVLLMAGAGPLKAASITGSIDPWSDKPTDLTPLGGLDWHVWDSSDTTTPENTKSGGSGIGALSTTPGFDGVKPNSFEYLTYTDGTSPASGSVQNAALNIDFSIDGSGQHSISIDASDTETRIARFFVSGWRLDGGEGDFTASLSGGGAAPYSVDIPGPGGGAGAATSRIITVEFLADGPGQTLDVVMSDSGDISSSRYLRLHAVALEAVPPAIIPEPATLCALAAGAAGLAGYLRRRRRARFGSSTEHAREKLTMKTGTTILLAVVAAVMLAAQAHAGIVSDTITDTPELLAGNFSPEATPAQSNMDSGGDGPGSIIDQDFDTRVYTKHQNYPGIVTLTWSEAKVIDTVWLVQLRTSSWRLSYWDDGAADYALIGEGTYSKADKRTQKLTIDPVTTTGLKYEILGRSGSGGQRAYLYEVQASGPQAAAIPEPLTACALAAGAAGLAGYLRRRRAARA